MSCSGYSYNSRLERDLSATLKVNQIGASEGESLGDHGDI